MCYSIIPRRLHSKEQAAISPLKECWDMWSNSVSDQAAGSAISNVSFPSPDHNQTCKENIDVINTYLMLSYHAFHVVNKP